MMTDNDLKHLFANQRAIDQALCPDFEDVEPATLDLAKKTSRPRLLVRIYAVTAVAALILVGFGFSVWQGLAKPDSPPQAINKVELNRIESVCDSLLLMIDDLDRIEDAPILDREMAWPTGTDSLLATNHVEFSFD